MVQEAAMNIYALPPIESRRIVLADRCRPCSAGIDPDQVTWAEAPIASAVISAVGTE